MNNSERVCSLVVTRTSVVPEVMGSTPHGNNILEFNGVVYSVIDDVLISTNCLRRTTVHSNLCNGTAQLRMLQRVQETHILSHLILVEVYPLTQIVLRWFFHDSAEVQTN